MKCEEIVREILEVEGEVCEAGDGEGRWVFRFFSVPSKGCGALGGSSMLFFLFHHTRIQPI